MVFQQTRKVRFSAGVGKLDPSCSVSLLHHLLSAAAPDPLSVALLCHCLFLQDCLAFVSLSSVGNIRYFLKTAPGKLVPASGC